MREGEGERGREGEREREREREGEREREREGGSEGERGGDREPSICYLLSLFISNKTSTIFQQALIKTFTS